MIGDYNLAAVQIVLGSFRVTGFAATDALNISPRSDLNEVVNSADGSHTSISRINDPTSDLTLTVRRGTAAYRLLGEALQAQLVESDAGAVSPLAFSVFDPITGDKFVEANIRFMREPDMPFSKAASDAEFALIAPNPTRTYGALIDTSA